MTYSVSGNDFIIKDFDKAPSFSSFFPGLCGVKGTPIWAFYVNRGQAIASFGTDDRDNAIMEFSPAPIAYEDVEKKGFRTFLRINGSIYEPFSQGEHQCLREMHISPNVLTITEQNHNYGIETLIRYFLLPNEPIGALVRRVSIRNLSQNTMSIELLDGLPRVLPYGIKNSQFKEMANLLKSYSEVRRIEEGIPIFTCRSDVADSAQVMVPEGGYFSACFSGGVKMPLICDPTVIFGHDLSLSFPAGFEELPLQKLLETAQYTDNKIPCAMSAALAVLEPQQELRWHSLTGYVRKESALLERMEYLSSADWIDEKEREARLLPELLTSDFKTETAVPILDAYLTQSNLDNMLRGGYPYTLGGAGTSIAYLFSRKHGDLERDYNFFTLSAEPYSQGNGNFRDVCQNRRSNVILHPELCEDDLQTFLDLIQLDGYNPLELRPPVINLDSCREAELNALLAEHIKDIDEKRKLKCFIKTSPTLGALSRFLSSEWFALAGGEEEFLAKLLTICPQETQAVYKEGYWIDHWTYLMGLLESYEKVYPDRIESLLFESRQFRYFDAPARVLPRTERYTLEDGELRQYRSIAIDNENRLKETHWVCDDSGAQLCVDLFSKLYLLVLLKAASLDPLQLGLEMEAGKPGWNDALNGLPGLLGSSTSELFDLRNMLIWLTKHLEKREDVSIPEAFSPFGEELADLIIRKNACDLDSFAFWDVCSSLREEWRQKIRHPISGKHATCPVEVLHSILTAITGLVDGCLDHARTHAQEGLIPSYFIYSGKAILRDDKSFEYLSFEATPLPCFLESPAKQQTDLRGAKAMQHYEAIRGSKLYDKPLGMYKTCVSLESVPMSCGRIRAFSPGWFERESVFTHLQYKYLLNILKSGLYDTFFREFQALLIPFQSPERYGRSILENSSFIVSSADSDPSLHGRGFVARLSGATAEVLSIWIRLFLGARLFYTEDNCLHFEFAPVLPHWMFDENKQVSVWYLNAKITYHNESQKNLYGAGRGVFHHMEIDGAFFDKSTGAILSSDCAERLRNKQISQIHIYYQ